MLYQLSVLFFFIPWSIAIAAQNSSKNQFHRWFTHSAKAPKGFEELTKPQTLLIDVYYLGHFIGVTPLFVTGNKIQFVKSQEILQKIELEHKEEIAAILEAPMDANSNLLCDKQQIEHCNELSPDTVDVIYDPDNFRISLFINPNYLPAQSIGNWIGPSSVGFSYLNHLYMVADSGNYNLPFANLFNPIIYQPLYNLTTDNLLAYENTRFNVSTSVANQANFNNLLDHNTVQINELNIAHTYHQYELRAGVINLPSTIFFASNTVLGGEIRTTLDTLEDKSLFLSTPINFFLPVTSTVSLMQGSTIIYSAKLPPGNQQIDTSTFPQGSYPVTVRVTDAEGRTTAFTKLVTNSVLLPPHAMPQSYFSLGYLMGIRQFNSNLYDSLLNIPVYQGGTNYRLTRNIGASMKLLGSNKAAFFNPGLAVLTNQFIIQPGVLVTTNRRYGYTTSINWQHQRWSANYMISQITTKNDPKENWCFKNNPTSCALNLLNQGVFYTSMSLSYGFSLGSAGASYSQSTFFDNILTTYGINFTTTLYQTAGGSWQLNLNATQNQVEANVFATISYNFNSAHTSGNVGTGYGYFRDNFLFRNRVSAPVQRHGNGLTTQGNLIYHKSDDTNHGYTMGLQANATPINKMLGLTSDLNKPKFHTNAYLTNYNDRVGSYFQYGGTFDTYFAWTDNQSAIGMGNTTDKTGILVRINARDPEATFDVFTDDQMRLHALANHNYLITLNPYKTWTIRVSDTSKNLYHFENSERLITVYPGNIQAINWQACKVIALAGQVFDMDNKPVMNTVVEGGLDFAMTDNEGYFQTTINEQHTILTINSSEYHCKIKLPQAKNTENLVYVDKLYCHPFKMRMNK